MEPVFDNFAEPPGVYIREELDARGWSQRDLAFILGYSEQTITKIISGKSGLTAEMAKALAEAFGTSAALWAGLQKEWELSEAREPDPAIKARAQMQSALPLREIINRSWIQDAAQSVLSLQLSRFFEGRSIDDLGFPAAARKTHATHTVEEIAWLYRVRQISRELEIPDYSEKKLRDALVELRSHVIASDDVRFVPDILKNAGVRFVVVERLSDCNIDGVCTWLDEHRPVVGLSLRHNRLDNFWFVLIHELEHVLRGHGKDTLGILDNLDGDASSEGAEVSDEERQANSAALNFCYPREKLLSFYARKQPYIAEADVVGFAGRNEVHPSIVVGQLQFLKKDYAWLRKWLVGVRANILPNCTVDGFNTVAKATL